MKGQWLGQYVSEQHGQILLDIDERAGRYEGAAFLFVPGQPGAFALFQTDGLAPSQTVEVVAAPLHPGGGRLSLEDFGKLYPDYTFTEKATVKLDWTGSQLSVKWSAPDRHGGYAMLDKSRAGEDSEYVSEPGINDWESFKEWVLGLTPERYIFRGQSCKKRLRTAFHRTERKNLVRFVHEDIGILHQALTSQTRHVFRLHDDLENGAFWNLIQHHGYPTPLLDWTYSPFVAAYFALRHRPHESEKDPTARIFVFDRTEWTRLPQYGLATYTGPHLSVLEALTIENQRAIPQQALSTVTNVDDIESYVRSLEISMSKTYLRVVDIPFDRRTEILNELRLMGITEASMFPGLDGACAGIKSRLFGY